MKQSASLALTMRNVENQNKRNDEIQEANQVAPEKQVRIRSRKLKLWNDLVIFLQIKGWVRKFSKTLVRHVAETVSTELEDLSSDDFYSSDEENENEGRVFES